MDRRSLINERDDLKSLLVPGTVPLPAHSILSLNESSNSEDNLPSTIDLDALKVPAFYESSYNVTTWRGAKRAKSLKVSGDGTGKKEQNNLMISNRGAETESQSDESKNSLAISSSSESDSETASSSSDSDSDSDSSSNSSNSSSSSDSVSSVSNHSLVSPQITQPVRKRGRPRKSLQNDTQSINNSSSTPSKNKLNNKSFSIAQNPYEPGSLKLKIAAFNPSLNSDSIDKNNAIDKPNSPWKSLNSSSSNAKNDERREIVSEGENRAETIENNGKISTIRSKDVPLSLNDSVANKVIKTNGISVSSHDKPKSFDLVEYANSVVPANTQLSEGLTIKVVESPHLTQLPPSSLSKKSKSLKCKKEKFHDPVSYLSKKKKCELSIFPISPSSDNTCSSFMSPLSRGNELRISRRISVQRKGGEKCDRNESESSMDLDLSEALQTVENSIVISNNEESYAKFIPRLSPNLDISMTLQPCFPQQAHKYATTQESARNFERRNIIGLARKSASMQKLGNKSLSPKKSPKNKLSIFVPAPRSFSEPPEKVEKNLDKNRVKSRKSTDIDKNKTDEIKSNGFDKSICPNTKSDELSTLSRSTTKLGVKTKAAIKYIPEIFESAQEMGGEKELVVRRGGVKKKKKSKRDEVKLPSSVSKRVKKKKLWSLELEELGGRLREECKIDESVKRLRRTWQKSSKLNNPFMLSYLNLPPTTTLSNSFRPTSLNNGAPLNQGSLLTNCVTRSTPNSPTKSMIDKTPIISPTLSLNRRKRGGGIFKSKSSSNLEGGLESAAKTLPLKKRHHVNQDFNMSNQSYSSNHKYFHKFGSASLTLYSLEKVNKFSHLPFTPAKFSKKEPFQAFSSLLPSNETVEKEVTAPIDNIRKKSRGRKKKKISNSNLVEKPKPKSPAPLNKSIPEKKSSPSTEANSRRSGRLQTLKIQKENEKKEEEVPSSEKESKGKRKRRTSTQSEERDSQPNAKYVKVSTNEAEVIDSLNDSKNKEMKAIKASPQNDSNISPLPKIITTYEESPQVKTETADNKELINTPLNISPSKKRRRTNKTGFPSVKKKKKPAIATPQPSVSETFTEPNSVVEGGEEDVTKTEQSFSLSLTERVKTRRRKSVDPFRLAMRLKVLNHELEIPGVSPEMLAIENVPEAEPVKTNYLRAGLLSGIFKGGSEEGINYENMTDEDVDELVQNLDDGVELMPLPPDLGRRFDVFGSVEDYELPYDIWCFGVMNAHKKFEEWCEENEEEMGGEFKKGKKVKKKSLRVREEKVQLPEIQPDSWKFKKVRSNTYFGYTKPPVTTESEVDQLCECRTEGESKCGSDDCLNRVMFSECPSACGEYCQNRKIQKHDWAPGLRRFLTSDKGYGVKSMLPLKKGEFILEYVGEVVSAEEFRRRMLEEYVNDTHHYCLQLDSNRFIDGHRTGGEGRFVNHSCEPNCEMQKWSVNGLYRMALFALRDIPPGEELTYDYNFSLYNETEGQPCYCQSENCRGVIGGKSSSKDVSRRKKLGQAKGLHDLQNIVLGGKYSSSSVSKNPMKHLGKKEIKFARAKNIFLFRNYEKIRCCRSASDGNLSERIAKLMTGWISKYKIGSKKNIPIDLSDQDPKVAKIVRTAQIFYDLYSFLVNAKDTSGKCLCEPFMDLPLRRRFPEFYRTLKDDKVKGLLSVEKKIIQGDYKSLQSLENDICIILSSFSEAYEADGLEMKGFVERIKKIYKEGKSRAMQALEPFIITPSVAKPLIGPTRLSTALSIPLPPFLPQTKEDFDDHIRCICGTHDEDGTMVQCEKCLVWQHCDCVGWTPDTSSTLIPKNSPKKKGGGRKRGGSSESPTRSRSDEPDGKIRVEFNAGEIIGVDEELPLLEDISEMETQILDYSESIPLPLVERICESGGGGRNDSYFCEKCKKRDVPREIRLNFEGGDEGKTYYRTLEREDGMMLRVNETVYVLRALSESNKYNADGTERARPSYKNAGPLNKDECDILIISQLYKDKDGNRLAVGYNYLRPQETTHEPNRRFYPNELLKSPIPELIPIDYIHGKCWVVDTAAYCKGRPIGCIEEHLYICDMRVNQKATMFYKFPKNAAPTFSTKPYAFRTFETKIKVIRNVHPHGPPSPIFKSRPNSSSSSGGSSSVKGNVKKRDLFKNKIDLEVQKELIKLQKLESQKLNINTILNHIQGRVENFDKDPIDMSCLLTKIEKP